MAEVLLSCEMLEDEMQLALQRTGVQMPIVWLDAGLHEYPAKLRAALREKIAELEQSYDTILLGFCLCGNAMDLSLIHICKARSPRGAREHTKSAAVPAAQSKRRTTSAVHHAFLGSGTGLSQGQYGLVSDLSCIAPASQRCV